MECLWPALITPISSLIFALKHLSASHEHRSVRKLLETARGDQKLLCDGARSSAWGRKVGNYNQLDADLYEIQFKKHHTWALLHDGNVLVRVEYGLPKLAEVRINHRQFKSDVSRILPDVKIDTELLFKLAQARATRPTGLSW